MTLIDIGSTNYYKIYNYLRSNYIDDKITNKLKISNGYYDYF